jgi:hypothetical protein
MKALDNWKQPYKYNAGGTWEPYPIPELENVPDNADWVEFLRSKGFERRDMIGGEFSAVQILLYDHKQHGYLIEVFSGTDQESAAARVLGEKFQDTSEYTIQRDGITNIVRTYPEVFKGLEQAGWTLIAKLS